MLPTLPEKYYLAHARELFHFVRQECHILLDEQHICYLDGITRLSEDAQCLLVRCLTRKPKFIKFDTLHYEEIDDIDGAFSELDASGYVSHAQTRDWCELVPYLTKPQLMAQLKQAQLNIKASSSKDALVEHAIANIKGDEPQLSKTFNRFAVRRHTDTVDYILFLFFGDLRNRFQQFAMRDLGVLKTRKSTKTIARFETMLEAQSAFNLQKRRRDFIRNPSGVKEELAEYLLTYEAAGFSAQQTRDKLLLNLGSELVSDNADKAISLWRASNDPSAVEKWVRESYKSQNRSRLKQELETLKESDLPATTEVFIEDFYARKFLGKRTSIFTDMLREPDRTLGIDEAFINDVEEGVIDQYHTNGVQAFFTENKFWRVLFALTFWELLFGPERKQFSEFDRLPLELRSNQFYENDRKAIERCLTTLDDPELALRNFSKITVQHYGKPTGIFHWSSNILDAVRPALIHAPQKAFAKVLTRMAINYRNARHGYPDIMVIENDRLRFEEIKAPGDVLRPNQLVSILRLRNAGFEVGVSQVRWATNPEQIYAVVDIETAGGRNGGNAITEIAVVKVRDQEIIGKWSTLVNPQRHIPAHITRLTGIDNSMVASAPVFSDIADELRTQLEGSIFVAHNVGFDYGFIKAAYEALGQSFRKPKYCTVRNSRKAFPGLRSYSLGALTEHFDIDLHGHHRALNDATATAHLLRLIQSQKASTQQPIL